MLNKPYKTIGNCRIYGNNHLIPFVYWHELTSKQREDFDYINDPDDNFTGFSYKGNIYSLDEFMRVENNSPFKGFDGYLSDSFYSGILIKLDPDEEGLKAYTFIS